MGRNRNRGGIGAIVQQDIIPIASDTSSLAKISNIANRIYQLWSIPSLDDAKSLVDNDDLWNQRSSRGAVAVTLYGLDEELASLITELSEKEQLQLLQQTQSQIASNDIARQVVDSKLIENIGNYGFPQARWNATLVAMTSPIWSNKDVKSPVNGLFETDFKYRMEQSLEHMLIQTAMDKGMTVDELKNIDVNNPSKKFINTMFDDFMQRFSERHASGITDNLMGAAMQTAIAQIGPNQENKNIKSFYPEGIVSPIPSNAIMQLLQKQYQKTQKSLRDRIVELYRGTNELELGIAMAPWSTLLDIAMLNGDVHNATIPKKYIFMTYKDSNFITGIPDEEEYLVLEGGLISNTIRRIPDTPFTQGNVTTTGERLVVRK